MISAPELATIYEDLRPTIIQYLLSLGLDDNQAQDTFHDVMIKFWHHYKQGMKPLNLAVQIAKHQAYNITKQKRLRNNLLIKFPDPEPVPTQEDTMIEEEDRVTINRVMLMHLKGTTYKVARLFLEGHAPAQISKLSGLSIHKVYYILRRIQ